MQEAFWPFQRLVQHTLPGSQHDERTSVKPLTTHWITQNSINAWNYSDYNCYGRYYDYSSGVQLGTLWQWTTVTACLPVAVINCWTGHAARVLHNDLKLHLTNSHGVSLVIWDHTVLPVTRHKWTHPVLTLARQAGTWCTYPGGMEGWVDLGDWVRTETVYLSANSHPSKYRN